MCLILPNIYFLHRAPVCARKDHLVYRDEMGITDYPAGMVETVLRGKKAWQLHLDLVVYLQAGKVDLEETNGSSARGQRLTAVMLVLIR